MHWGLHPEVPILTGYFAAECSAKKIKRGGDPAWAGFACEGEVRNRVSGFSLRNAAVR